MTIQIKHLPLRPGRPSLSATLWAISAACWALLMFTDPDVHIRAAYLAAAVMFAMWASTLIIVFTLRRLFAGVSETLETTNRLNETLIDRTVGEVVQRITDSGRPVRLVFDDSPQAVPCPVPGPRASGNVYYDHILHNWRPVGDGAESLASVVPLPASRPRRTEAS